MENIKVLSLLLCICVSAKAVDKRCSYVPFAGSVQTDQNTTKFFSYSPKENKCFPFNYGGYGGNGNRFKSLEECEKACRGKNPCNLVPFSGNGDNGITCFMVSDAWSYVAAENKCVEYKYYCGGNENVFESAERCENKCKRDPCADKPFSGSKDHLASKHCGLDIVRYTYFPFFKECVKYSYGGCGANLNSFDTFKECQELCEL